MSNERNAEATKQKILEAAKRIMGDGGYFTRFTLEKVAKEAGVSKGGLLHHFPSKEALLKGLVEYFVDGFETRLSEILAIDADNPRPGRWTRAYIQVALAEAANDEPNISPALLAFLRADEADTDSVRNRFKYWQAQAAEDELDPVQATIIRLAVDGLFYTEIVDAAKIDDDLRAEVIARLIEMTEE